MAFAGGTNGTTDNNWLEGRTYIRWDDPGVEKKPDGEDEDIQAVADMINGAQRAVHKQHKYAYSGTHAKTQGIVRGVFRTEPNLPPHLKQSMFSEEREWPVLCRYSSEPPDPSLDDRNPQPRGFAMKVFDVHGEFFDEGKDIPTQDIEFNSTPALDLANARTTREIIDLRLKYLADPPEMAKRLEARDDTELQTAREKVRNTHLESTRQYSQTAYRFGDFVMKYSLVPNSNTQKKLYDETVQPEHGDGILRRWLQNFHRDHEAEYLFQVQLCENLKDQPVEYSGKAWDEQKYPWQTVARLLIPKQDSFIEELKDFWQLRMRISPWMGLKTLQPLGSSNRLRRVVYPASSALRRELNGTTAVDIMSMNDLPVH